MRASQEALVVKNLPANAGDARDAGFDPWVRKIPWRREQISTPVFLPGESHAWWAIVHRVAELDTTEATEHTQLFSEKQNAARKVVKLRLVSRLCVF